MSNISQLCSVTSDPLTLTCRKPLYLNHAGDSFVLSLRESAASTQRAPSKQRLWEIQLAPLCSQALNLLRCSQRLRPERYSRIPPTKPPHPSPPAVSALVASSAPHPALHLQQASKFSPEPGGVSQRFNTYFSFIMSLVESWHQHTLVANVDRSDGGFPYT